MVLPKCYVCVDIYNYIHITDYIWRVYDYQLFSRGVFFLSNFYETPVVFEELTYTSSEAAFQAAKTTNQNERMKFTTLNPFEAKREGRHVQLRSDWEKVKYDVMY